MRIFSGVAALRPAAVVACASLLVGACSGTGTFPGPSWNLTGGKDAAPLPLRPIASDQTRQATLPTEPQPLSMYRGGRDPITGRAPTSGGSPQGFQPAPVQSPPATQAQPLPSPNSAPSQVPAARAAQVEVRPGQSLAAVASEQRVSIASLMAANKLRDPYVIPGQVLTIPRP